MKLLLAVLALMIPSCFDSASGIERACPDSFFYENLIELSSSNILNARRLDDIQLQKTYQERYCLILFVFWLNHVDANKPVGEIERISKLVRRTFKNYSTPEILKDPLHVDDIVKVQRYKGDQLFDMIRLRYGDIPLKKGSIDGENLYRDAVKKFNEWLASGQ
jgi:hypothetical protein